jgi:ribosomal protein L37AE/L43A
MKEEKSKKEKEIELEDREKQEQIEECNHEWTWRPDKNSTYTFLGIWQCTKCGLFRP